nr:glycoprotein Xg isoform X3 [Neomonachus schauinslandi]
MRVGPGRAGSHESLGWGLHGGSFVLPPKMESRWGLFCITVLGFLMHIQGQRDFDLADALDDPEPTKKPSSDIYPKPKPPYRPQPGMPDDSGSIYPKPRPPPRPQPGGSDGGGGYFGNTDRDDGRYPPRPKPPAGGDGHSTYGNPQGNMVAKIVSPIVSVLVVTLVGAAAGFCQRNRRRNCFRTNEPAHV